MTDTVEASWDTLTVSCHTGVRITVVDGNVTVFASEVFSTFTLVTKEGVVTGCSVLTRSTVASINRMFAVLARVAVDTDTVVTSDIVLTDTMGTRRWVTVVD